MKKIRHDFGKNISQLLEENILIQVSDLRNDLGLGFEKWKWLRRVNFGSGRGNLGLGFEKNLGDDELKKDGEKS